MTKVGEWMDDAACLKVDPELFFPTGSTGMAAMQIEEAKAVCRSCPVIDSCLKYALEYGEYGVWGGKSEDERRAIKRRKARRAIGKSALGA